MQSLPLLALLVACVEAREADCRRFVEVLNRAAPELEAAQAGATVQDTKRAWENLRKVAEIHGRLADEVGALALHDEGFAPRVEAWRAATERVEDRARAVVGAAESGDRTRAMELLHELRGAVVEHEERLEDINRYCAGG